MRFFASAPGFGDAGKRIFNRAVLLFVSLWTVAALFFVVIDFWGGQHRLALGLFDVVDGIVSNYKYNGRSVENFSVNGHHFSYADCAATFGFHTPPAVAGPFARVCMFA
jgi:hypothetical protein